MAAKKGEAKPEVTEAKQAEIFEAICLMYESQHCTIDSAAQANGISPRAFYLWRAKNAEFAERYKKAANIRDVNYWENVIKPLADTGLQRLLKGETFKERKEKIDVNSEGEQKVTEMTVTKRKVLPNATVVIFANKGIYPEKFVEHSKVEQQVNITNDSWFDELPLEKRLAIMKIIDEEAKEKVNDAASSK